MDLQEAIKEGIFKNLQLGDSYKKFTNIFISQELKVQWFTDNEDDGFAIFIEGNEFIFFENTLEQINIDIYNSILYIDNLKISNKTNINKLIKKFNESNIEWEFYQPLSFYKQISLKVKNALLFVFDDALKLNRLAIYKFNPSS